MWKYKADICKGIGAFLMGTQVKNVLVFGAGASYGSGDVEPKPPPMTEGLLHVLKRLFPTSWGIIKGEELGQLEDDFEEGIKKIGEVNPHLLPPLQRAMASFFFGFIPGENNLYRKLARKLLDVEWSGALVTLNYERLLELALGAEGLKPFVGTRPEGENNVEMCFPHGCCHLFCDSVRGTADGLSFSGFNVSTSGTLSVVANPSDFQNRIKNDAFPPVMSYFEPEKRTSSGVNFIEEQRARYSEMVIGADNVVLVGIRIRPNDNHIWKVVSETQSKIIYCAGSRSGDEFINWCNEYRSGKDNVVIGDYFEESIDLICQEIGLNKE